MKWGNINEDAESCELFEKSALMRENVLTSINDYEWKIIALYGGKLKFMC